MGTKSDFVDGAIKPHISKLLQFQESFKKKIFIRIMALVPTFLCLQKVFIWKTVFKQNKLATIVKTE